MCLEGTASQLFVVKERPQGVDVANWESLVMGTGSETHASQ